MAEKQQLFLRKAYRRSCSELCTQQNLSMGQKKCSKHGDTFPQLSESKIRVSIACQRILSIALCWLPFCWQSLLIQIKQIWGIKAQCDVLIVVKLYPSPGEEKRKKFTHFSPQLKLSHLLNTDSCQIILLSNRSQEKLRTALWTGDPAQLWVHIRLCLGPLQQALPKGQCRRKHTQVISTSRWQRSNCTEFIFFHPAQSYFAPSRALICSMLCYIHPMACEASFWLRARSSTPVVCSPFQYALNECPHPQIVIDMRGTTWGRRCRVKCLIAKKQPVCCRGQIALRYSEVSDCATQPFVLCFI